MKKLISALALVAALTGCAVYPARIALTASVTAVPPTVYAAPVLVGPPPAVYYAPSCVVVVRHGHAYCG